MVKVNDLSTLIEISYNFLFYVQFQQNKQLGNGINFNLINIFSV